jgi:hypothetical protein
MPNDTRVFLSPSQHLQQGLEGAQGSQEGHVVGTVGGYS